MSLNYVDRAHDEEIIDIVRSIMSHETMEVQTFNEAILAALMEKRGTPIRGYSTSRDIWKDFERWKDQSKTK